MLELAATDLEMALAVAVPFLHLAGIVCGAWQWGRAAELAGANLGNGENPYFGAQIGLAEFYFPHVLPAAAAHVKTVFAGTDGRVDGACLLM